MINNIQALRAFAAINVVLFHIIGTSASYSQSVGVVGFLEGWGANGVDIFFVISGFVMLHTQITRRSSPCQFLKNRIIRIAPIYWMMTLFIVALFLVSPSIFRTVVVTPGAVLSSLSFTSAIFIGKFPIVYVGWTLEWEMFFYVTFAIGLFFEAWSLQAVFVVGSIFLISALSGNYIATEFLFGMLAAYVYKKFDVSRKKGAAIFISGGIMLMFSISPPIANLELNRVIIWGVPSFLIVCGLLYCSQVNGRLLIYLGGASYSIYLVQMMTIPAFYKFTSVFMRHWDGDVLAVACLICTIALGCGVYSLLEKPVTDRLRRLFDA